MQEHPYQPSGPTRQFEYTTINLEIVENAFPGANIGLLGAVCFATAAQIHYFLPRGFQMALLIDRSPDAFPRHLYARGPEGQNIIFLAPSHEGNYWAQFAYQFAHEFVHAIASEENIRLGSAIWLEEAICECGSLFALPRLAGILKNIKLDACKPLTDYAPHFEEYIQDVATNHTLAIKRRELPDWLNEQLPNLRNRDRFRLPSQLLASQLLPLFESNPSGWDAVRYMNRGADLKDSELAHFLQQWQDSVPKQHQRFVRDLSRLLGITVIRENFLNRLWKKGNP